MDFTNLDPASIIAATMAIVSVVISVFTLRVFIWQTKLFQRQTELFREQTELFKDQTELLRKQLQGEHEWRRRERALSYSQIYIDSTIDVKKHINETIGPIMGNSNILTPDKIKIINDTPHLREDINFLLSHLENIGLSVLHNVNDFQVTYDLIAHTYIRYYEFFKPYIDEGRKHNKQLWKNIQILSDELVKKIKEEEQKEEEEELKKIAQKRLGRTG